MTDTATISCERCGCEVTIPVLTGPAARFNGIAKRFCDSCIAVLEEQEQAHARREAMIATVAKLQALGDLAETTPSCVFERSRNDVEARNAESWRAVREWDATRNLYLSGPPGTGKTFAGRCLLNQHIERGKTVAELPARRVFKADRLFNDGGAMQRWESADLLLLDDLDKARWTPDALGALWELIDARCSRDVRTVCTANVPWARLGELMSAEAPFNSALAESIGDRLSPVRLQFDGASLRGAK